MTAPYHLIAFWEQDKEKELPAIGCRVQTTIQHNCSAAIFLHPEKPLCVLVESNSTLSGERRRRFFGRLDSKDLSHEQLQKHKKIGLFQLAIPSQVSQDPMLPPPPPLIYSRGALKNKPQTRVYCTTPTADYQRFEAASRTAKNAEPETMGYWLTQRSFVSGREEWQPIDYAQEWYRELKALHDTSGPDERIKPDPKVLYCRFRSSLLETPRR